MNKFLIFFALLIELSLPSLSQTKSQKEFVRVDHQNLIMPDGKQLNIKGINLGNWLNPEGYMMLLGNQQTPIVLSMRHLKKW